MALWSVSYTRAVLRRLRDTATTWSDTRRNEHWSQDAAPLGRASAGLTPRRTLVGARAAEQVITELQGQ